MARYIDRLDAYFYPRAGERDGPELRQETLVRLLGSIHRFRGDSAFSTFLFGIANNVLREHYRRKQSGRVEAQWCSLDGVHVDIPVACDFDNDLPKLLAALRRLSAEEYDLVIMRGMDRLRFAEIARILGLHPSTARRRHLAARDQLLKLMQQLPKRPRGLSPSQTFSGPSIETQLRWLRALLHALGPERWP
ncbi:MAG: sigma-70 family RNA polymerase sigma factor, partial [Deltaproteobacteria bacterium]|nr:sigma-70 family RNA polymerase sigma factor [Deltaproteobacteria bacterium]